MKTCIKLLATAIVLLLAGASFAQTARPPLPRHPAKHSRHYRHPKKAFPAKHRLRFPAPPPPPKLPPPLPRP